MGPFGTVIVPAFASTLSDRDFAAPGGVYYVKPTSPGINEHLLVKTAVASCPQCLLVAQILDLVAQILSLVAQILFFLFCFVDFLLWEIPLKNVKSRPFFCSAYTRVYYFDAIIVRKNGIWVVVVRLEERNRLWMDVEVSPNGRYDLTPSWPSLDVLCLSRLNGCSHMSIKSTLRQIAEAIVLYYPPTPYIHLGSTFLELVALFWAGSTFSKSW